jgi:ATPase subunit of ABC transporter with duplicated ATPase domains
MISVSDLAKSFGPQTLFAGVSFQLNPGNRYGLVGANGSGKSTFLRILSGEEPPSAGQLSIPKRLKLGVLRQDHFRFDTMPILEVAMMGHAEVWQAMIEKEELLSRAHESFDGERYAELEDIILSRDGYQLEARAGEILEGLGIPTEVHRQPLSTLSGGFKLRVLLAQVLAGSPDALLLDEPTNHLDILSIRWLEKFLAGFPGCVVVISHDHRFLDNVCTHILDVDYETIALYKGNYTEVQEAKGADRERLEAEIARREKRIAEVQAFVDRFRYKATKARQAQSKAKLIEKMAEGLEKVPVSSRRYPTFRLGQVRPSGKEVLTLEGIAKSYGPKRVLTDVSLSVWRGDRLAIIGPNGIGKSTLLKVVLGQVAADAGTYQWGYETHPGYFSQDARELFADPRQSVEAWLWDAVPQETIGFVRAHLGMVLFSGDEVKKNLGALSGGEAARLVFCRLGVLQPNVLILDEPTNHLDLEAIEALVTALKDYDGTLLFVSHDRWFVSELATRILELSPEGIQDFAGTYEDYLAYSGDDHLDAEQVVLKVKRDRRKDRDRAPRSEEQERADRRELDKERKRLETRLAEITRAVDEAEARVHAINEAFCDPTFFERTPRPEVRRLEEEQKELSTRIAALMKEWESLEERLAASSEAV